MFILPLLVKNALKVSRKPILTILLLFATLFFSVRGLLQPQLILKHAFCPALFSREPLTALTYAFYHTGAVPLIINLVCLWVFGKSLEETTSHWFFLFTVLTSSVGYLFGFAVTAKDPYLGVVGLSGVVSGVMGASFVVCRRTSVIALALVGIVPLLIEMSLAWVVYYFLAVKTAVVILNHVHHSLPPIVQKFTTWVTLPIVSSGVFLWGCVLGASYRTAGGKN